MNLAENIAIISDWDTAQTEAMTGSNTFNGIFDLATLNISTGRFPKKPSGSAYNTTGFGLATEGWGESVG